MKNLLNRLLADNRGRGTFRVDNASMADEATIYLYDAIVSDDWCGCGVTAIDFVTALAAITAPTIHIRINSPGGEVFPAQAIAQAIREKPAKCIAHIDGCAASCASWIALAASETFISPGGMVMIHSAETCACGNAADLRETADLLDKVNGILAAGYVKETGQTAEQISAWMAEETWFTAEEAVANGFADRISEAASPNNLAAWNLGAYANAPHPPERKERAPANLEHLRRRLFLAVHL